MNIFRRRGRASAHSSPHVAASYPPDFDEELISIVERVRPFTMTSPERIAALVHAVDYVVKASIPGDIVECGVWRGGSMMAAALRLQSLGVTDRRLHLFDTFDGMTDPVDADVDLAGGSARSQLDADTERSGDVWAVASQEEVAANLGTVGYDSVSLVEGRVEDTLPPSDLAEIAILRLDTDWYESTRHELETLYPRLSSGGVLMIDDYGHWQGARRAVDEFFEDRPVFLSRIDYTGRLAIKP